MSAPRAGLRPTRPPRGPRKLGAARRFLAKTRGFTLIEVLVALVIVAVALAAGLRAAGALTNNAQRLDDVITAQWCADNALANLRLTHQMPSIGDADFGCEQLGRSFAGQLQSRATPNPNFRRVEAIVLDADGHVLVNVSTVIGRY